MTDAQVQIIAGAIDAAGQTIASAILLVAMIRWLFGGDK